MIIPLRPGMACLWLATLVLCSGCANKPTVPDASQQRSGQQTQEATPQYRAQLHTDLGAGYYERGQMQIALEELNEAVSIEPNYAPAYNIFGLIYAVLGQDQKAEQSFARALQLAPNDSDIRHNWGWYLCQHKREREALAQFEAAVSNPLYKTPEVALVNAARCAQATGDMRLAESYFRRALAVQPGNPLASYGLALIAYKEAHYQDARSLMKSVMLTNNPSPEGLYLGMCVERKLGDRQAELSYLSQLRNRYPDSPESKASQSGACE